MYYAVEKCKVIYINFPLLKACKSMPMQRKSLPGKYLGISLPEGYKRTIILPFAILYE